MRKHPDVEKILLTPSQIQRGIRKLAERISKDFAGKNLVLVCILKGGVVFLSDLIRQLKIPCAVDFMSVASYSERADSSGVARLLLDLRGSPEGKDVLLVEDILDTGLTIRYLLENLKTRNARSLKVCVLLDKTGDRKVDVEPDYAAFRVPDKFVVGYGLDYAERYRSLPYIGVLKEQVISGK